MSTAEILTEWPAGWLTTGEAAARRGVHIDTVRRWIRAGLRAARVLVGSDVQFAVEPNSLEAFAPRRRGAPAGNQFAAGARRKSPAKSPRNPSDSEKSRSKSANP